MNLRFQFRAIAGSVALTKAIFVNFFSFARAYTCSYEGFRKMRERFSVDAAIRKSFENERWVVTLTADDIFKTIRERWTMYGMGAEASKDCYNYSRSIALRVTYNFNNTRTKYKGTGAGNDEKRRM